jgi:hypothetical protein
MIWFVYVDYRLDIRQPFYVGKGNSSRVSRVNRNKHHSHVVAKHGFYREVVLGTRDEKFALEHEVRLIKELRTRDFFGGCNYTDGGDGVSGLKHSDASNEKNRLAHTGRVYSQKTCLQKSESMLMSARVRRKAVQRIDTSGNVVVYESICSAERDLKKSGCATLISRCCLGKTKTAYGYAWKFLDDIDKNGPLSCIKIS